MLPRAGVIGCLPRPQARGGTQWTPGNPVFLPEIRGKFLMSSYPSAQLTELRDAHGFRHEDFTMALAVTGKRTGKLKTECLTWNYGVENTMPLFELAGGEE